MNAINGILNIRDEMMKFFLGIIFLLVSFNIYAELPKPKIDTKRIIEQMDIQNQDYLYTNENGDQKEGFKQVFFVIEV